MMGAEVPDEGTEGEEGLGQEEGLEGAWGYSQRWASWRQSWPERSSSSW
jgi:hypothetical protein